MSIIEPIRPLELAPSAALVRLDLACGQNPREGFAGVDLYAPSVSHVVDLMRFPWPWADSSVDELHCSHFVEHLPCRDVGADDGSAEFVGRDFFFAFFDEAWRVLKPDAIMTIIVPCGRSSRAFQDPTHRRFIMAETFAYLSRDWREANKLDHYRVRANFGSNIVPVVPIEMNALSQEAQARRFAESWNVIHDWHATLKRLA